MREMYQTLLGILVGLLITSVFARKSSSELREHMQRLKHQLEGQNRLLKQLADHIEPNEPALSEEIRKAVSAGEFPEVQLGVFSDGDVCPSCGASSLRLVRYGNGPLGHQNAWYGCANCQYQFQTIESFGDS